ncbi:MAG TPA: hypothetical protein VFX30_10025 [bacterium]|nr:hypothetical protein [bacterium]
MRSKLLFGIALSLIGGIIGAASLSAQEAPALCSTADPSSCEDSDPCTFDFCRRTQSDTVGGQGLGVCIHSPLPDCPAPPPPEPEGCGRFGTDSVDFQCCEAGFDLDADPENFKCCEESVSQGGSPQACGTPIPPPPAETPPPSPPPASPPAEPQPEPAPAPEPAPEAVPPAAEPAAPTSPVCGNDVVEMGEECDGGPACDVECHINLAAFPDCRIPAADLLTLKPFEIVDQYGFDEFEKCARIGGGGGAGLDHFDPKDLPSNRGASAGGCSLIL